jgi:hypothetical protein
MPHRYSASVICLASILCYAGTAASAQGVIGDAQIRAGQKKLSDAALDVLKCSATQTAVRVAQDVALQVIIGGLIEGADMAAKAMDPSDEDDEEVLATHTEAVRLGNKDWARLGARDLATLRWGSVRTLSSAERQSLLAHLQKQTPLQQVGYHPDLQRWLLRESMGTSGTKQIAHHIIPLEAIGKCGGVIRKGVQGGFNMNGRGNGLAVSRSDHIGGHKCYNEAVLEQVCNLNAALPASDLARELGEMVATLRSAVDAGTFGPWANICLCSKP